MEEDKLQVVEDDDHDEEALNQNSSSKHNNLNDTSFKEIMVSPLHDSNELFEFFNGFTITSDMCPAEDIISCGKLVPFKDKDKDKTILTEPKKLPHINRRRSESLSSLMRNSRSMDYQRLDDVIYPALEYDRSFSTRNVMMSDKKAMKPRWYSIMFGTMKVPHEMVLNDIKNRQFRRNPSTTMFPVPDNGGVNRFSGKVSWRILKALSCKDPSSVTVTTSFPMPQAS
ncbi:hypothetical protein Lal_00006489 [Lupinus albus]|uniref:Uncharacterized protein n=1 Tax=Lupinus albus TaxID=3870 RepID=A0A6A5MU56_LUPAL|nr:hypothetical protein Lalb_Chr07g0180461 [Lupinus albus]KAF1875858.1 hypothetical protein Lal_00006489 [Lupinus albus]